MKKKLLIVIPTVLVVVAAVVAIVLGLLLKSDNGINLELSSKSLKMDALEKVQLTATVTNSGGEVIDKKVNWSSDNTQVVTVEDGVLTALTAGEATVTAEVEGQRAQCQISVSAVVRPMMVFIKAEYEVGKGTTAQIVPNIRFKSENLDTNAYGITYTFTSADTNIATVNEKGVISGVAVGETEVIIKANFPMATAAGLDGEMTASVKVKVVPDYTLNIDVAEGYTTDIYMQEVVVEDVTCYASVPLRVLAGLYEDQDIRDQVSFCSSDDTIAVVSEEGVVTLSTDAREGDEVDVWARYVTPNEGEVNSNRITLMVRKAVVEKQIKGDLLIDLSAGGSINSYAVFGSRMKIIDVYDSEDPYKTSLWNSEKGRLDPEAVQTLGQRSLVIVGEKISCQVNALVASKVIRTAQDFANIFFRSTSIPAIKADGYYVLGNNIDCSEIKYVGRGWNATDGNGLTGTFDGRGYTMDGFNMPYGGGIFGVISSKATVKNVAFTNVKMNSNGHSVILGYGVYGKVENVFVGITELGSSLDSPNTVVGLFGQGNTANVLKNIVVVSSAKIVCPAKSDKFGILEGMTNKGAWENAFAVSPDRLFGGANTAGDNATTSAKAVYRFGYISGLLGSNAYQEAKEAFPADIWDLSTATFKSSRQFFKNELDECPESLVISVNKEEPLVTNYNAFSISTNSKKLKVQNGILVATGEVAAKENAKVTIIWGGIKKTISVKTRQEKTVDMTYELNKEVLSDLVVSGLPVNKAAVKVYFLDIHGKEIEVDGACSNGKLVVSADTMRLVQERMASGEQTIRIDYGAADDYYVNGIDFVWLINNANELLKMRDHMTLEDNTYYGMIALNANIDLSNVNIANSGLAGKIYDGVFDGRFHKLTNMNVRYPNVGLLGDVSGTVKNLRVENATVSTNTAAVIGGALTGTAENIYVQGSVTADAMKPSSNLSNFGCGLLVGRIEKTAKINNVIVEVQQITDGLRLATAFGKLHAGAPNSVFTNCYAVNAANKTFMQNTSAGWQKLSFPAGSSNKNFGDMYALWDNAKAAALAKSLGLTAPLVGLNVDMSYDLNGSTQKDLVISGLDLNRESVKAYFMGVDGKEIPVDASCKGGKLVVTGTAMEAIQTQLATGMQPIRIAPAGEYEYILGVKFVWIINNADELLKMREHLTLDGNEYYGMLALGADVDLTNVKIANAGMASKKFTGVFDGRFHKLTNLAASAPNVGLLGDVSGTVENLRVENAVVSTNTAAVIGGGFSGTARYIYVSGSVIGDGMNANSNLSNFGSGLLAGRIEKTAKIDHVIVEVHEITNTLRLATAFGKLHAGAPQSVFTNCYAVGADGLCFMDHQEETWNKLNFAAGSTNAGFPSMWDLWQNKTAKALAEKLGIGQPEKPAVVVTVKNSYDMNVAGSDFVVTDSRLTGNFGGVSVQGSNIKLPNATLVNSTLTIPAESFQQDAMPSGNLKLIVELGEDDVHVAGEFVWVLHSWDDLATMENHMVINGSNYTGSLALDNDISMSGKSISSWLWKNTSVYTFNGTFDGRNHTISDVNANSSTKGIFRSVGADGIVKNLKIRNAKISNYTAAVVGYQLRGTLENIFVQGAITADGMGATSNLSNFGCGLLAAQICSGAKISNCIVELTSIADNLRLGSAFGKLHNLDISEASVFTNCYAVGAGSNAFMPIDQGDSGFVWVRKAFDETNGKGNKNYTDMRALGNASDIKVQAVIEKLKLDCTDLGHNYVAGQWSWSEDPIGAKLEASCSRCGDTTTYTAEITKGAGSVDATCNAPGVANYIASVKIDGVIYSDSKTVQIPQMIHTVTHVAAKAANCMETGNTEHWYCPGCLKYYTDAQGENTTTLDAVTIPKTDHSYDQLVATNTFLKSAGTETERAQYYKSCICGKVGTEVFYGSYAMAVDVNNGKNLTIQHDVFKGTGNATVTIGDATLKGIYASGRLIITDSALRAATKLPTGEVEMVVSFGDKTVTIPGMSLVWVIRSWDELAYMENHLVMDGSDYVGSLALGADIDAAGKNLANFLWKDSGRYTFNGSFDGRNYTISNVNANTPLKGLFRSVGPKGIVKNLKMTGVTVSTYTAGLVGYQLYGTLQNIYVQGIITADGMSENSNLANFGSSLLAAQICKGAKLDGCIVELTQIAEDLRLATAFGKLHQPETLEADVFTNCYAVGADGCTFMPYSETKEGWSKASFTKDSQNLNFATMDALWLNEDAKALALELEMEPPVQGAVEITLNNGFEMNAGKDLVVEAAGLTGSHSGTIAVSGTSITLPNAVIANGKLTIPAASFNQDTMPSGPLTLIGTFGDLSVEITGEFIWVIQDWAGLAYMEKHMVINGTNYVGNLALGADIDASGKNIANFLWKSTTVYTFNGTFDGRDHTITGLAANSPLKGLFKSVGAEGIVKNLRMKNATVSTYSGAVVGFQLFGTLENIYVQGSITGDGMGATSNLANFGSGLLTGQIMGGAKINNTIVELTGIKSGLRLATAFGKIHQGNTTEASVFNNCYAVGAEGCTFMQYGTWAKQSFTPGSANKTFSDLAALWNDSTAAALAAKLGLTQ